jgi:hypothetical protein
MVNQYTNYKKIKRVELILNSNFEDLGWDRQKEYLKYESNNTCQRCHNSEWMGQPIPLEIDHIDGNNKNNLKENLIVLCPNCHALTDNWRGRNKTNKLFRVSNEELLNAILKYNYNFRKALIDVGLTPKGGNYKRCHKIKREYDDMGYVNATKTLHDISKDVFIENFNKSNNYSELANKLNISYARVRQYAIEYDCEFKKKQIPELTELLDNYKKFGNFTKLSQFYGMSDNGVRKWFVKYGIDPKEIKKLTM